MGLPHVSKKGIAAPVDSDLEVAELGKALSARSLLAKLEKSSVETCNNGKISLHSRMVCDLCVSVHVSQDGSSGRRLCRRLAHGTGTSF